jgi:membrane protease YdiL (CAAX protease family)
MTETSQPNRIHLEIAAVILFIPLFVNGFHNPLLIDKTWLFWILDIFNYIVVPIGVAVFLFSRSGLRAHHIGLYWPKCTAEWIKLIIHTVGFSLTYYFIAYHLSKFFSKAYPSQTLFRYEWMIPTDFISRLLISFYFALTAGIAEEFYCRGILVKLFSQYGAGKFWIVLLVSSLFAIAHWEGGVKAVLATFFIGAFITTYYTRFKLLFPVIVAHFIYDWIVFF